MASPGEHSPTPSDVTLLLDAMSAGNPKASAELLPLVYNELRRLASGQMQHERPGQTLQPTALVHEAYMRMLGDGDVKWNNRGHFFGAAALAMRRILVERARARGAIKRGGARKREDVDLGEVVEEREPTDMLALDDALAKLEREDKRKYNVVMLRYFAGLTIDQTAASLDVSSATVRNDWAFARAWLHREMSRDGGAESEG